MRKLAAIFFLSIFLVYHVGYIGLHWLSVKQITKEWQSKDQYDGQLKKVSIPVSFPYMPDQHEYISTDGTITIDGKIYRKVMHKYVQNTIHLIIVEDHLSENLNQSFEDWINSMTGTQSNKSEQSSLIKSLVKEFFEQAQDLDLAPGFHFLTKKYFFYITNFQSLSADIDTPPPRVDFSLLVC